MPTVELTINMTIDGIPSRGFPFRLRRLFDELQQFDYEEANDGDLTTFSQVPVGEIGSVQALLYRAKTGGLGLRVEGSESGNVAIRLSEGGLVLIWDATITNTNITVNNNDGAAVRADGFGAGT